MACPPVGNGICKNSKFKSTISSINKTGFVELINDKKGFSTRATKIFNYFSRGVIDFNKKIEPETIITFYIRVFYVIDNNKSLSYKMEILNDDNPRKVLIKDLRFNSLQEFADSSIAIDLLDKSQIQGLVNKIKSLLNKKLEKQIVSAPPPKSNNPTQTTALRASQGGLNAPAQTQAQAPASGGTQATSPGASTTQGQTAAVAPTSDKIDASLASLQDTGYLNTSKPKNFPLIDQPNGSYKPLSEVSRFVFDSANASDTYAIAPEENVRNNSNNIKFSQSNRKYFGANLAVLNKLESVDFKSGFDKQDYIAYLIPYGTPGIASNPSQTVSTQIPGADSLIRPGLAGANTAKGNGEVVAKNNSAAFDLFKSASIAFSLSSAVENTENLSVSELDKVYTFQWNSLLNKEKQSEIEAASQLIINTIKNIYDKDKYPGYEKIIKDKKLRLKPIESEYQKIISNLGKSLSSLSKKVVIADTFQPDIFGSQNFVTDPTNQFNLPTDSYKFNVKEATENFNKSKQLIEDVASGKAKFSSVVFTGKSADPTPVNNKDAGVTGVDPSLKIWQFLYNPQSITIDVKADYAESNTWGATDDGQSGQSVLWQRNKNPVMRLDEVVLNGFIHGKKVAQLEEGLFALLMSRDGPGQIEPTVWEFVWGRRRFGPCIINDIQVVEKQWEAGEVLTATVSFTLTQIPKWQIIDSTVKFYDPTAMGTFAAPPEQQTAPSSTSDTQPSGTTDAEQKANAPGGGGKSDPCRAVFNNTLDNAIGKKSVVNYLFACSKKTNPPIDLYKNLINSKDLDSEIENILSKLNAQCNTFEGGKTPAGISTPQQGEEYKKQAKPTLKQAYKEAVLCKNRNKDRSERRSPRSVNNLLEKLYKGTEFKLSGTSFTSFRTGEEVFKYYESCIDQALIIYNKGSRQSLSEGLATYLNFDKPFDSKRFLNFRKNYSDLTGNLLFAPEDRRLSFQSETRRLFQGFWLFLIVNMKRKDLNIPVTSSNLITRADYYIQVKLDSNRIPIGYSVELGNGKKVIRDFQ